MDKGNMHGNDGVFAPSDNFKMSANIKQTDYDDLCLRAENDYVGFWADLAHENVLWSKPFTHTLNETNAPFYTWFEDGELNVSYNCLDRHLATNANKIALIHITDDGTTKNITYQELHSQVCTFANGLKSLGVTSGDRVVIYMPHSIEAIVAMQACARIGVIHSVVFAGFSAKSIAERILDAGAKVVITADGQVRAGKTLSLKEQINEALTILDAENFVTNVIVQQRIKLDISTNWQDGRDVWWHDLISTQSNVCAPTTVGAEHPLFILYTSGSTGTPKGVQHSSAGYLLGAILTMRWVFDIKLDDVFWCTADVGWITGHTYACYGPLAVGATQVVFEGVPTYPDAGRFWQIIEQHKVSIFYTAPTALRTLIKIDAELPKKFNLSSLRLLGSVGEPINPEVWRWYYTVVGQSKCPVVDTWWQTETGCNMLAPIPGIAALKPGSCTFALPGIMAGIVDEVGNDVEKVGDSGYLVIKKPFPSQLRTIWQNPERYRGAYYPDHIANGTYYVAGDSAAQDMDGYYWIGGRIDDVLNVSGHRLGTAEIESALVLHPRVAEAAVVGMPHPIKGEAICAFVVCRGNNRPIDEEANGLAKELRDWVGHEIGAIAKPEEIRFGDNLPKTRSGKIMRRLLRSIARGEEITQDISTLENPDILTQLMSTH